MRFLTLFLSIMLFITASVNLASDFLLPRPERLMVHTSFWMLAIYAPLALFAALAIKWMVGYLSHHDLAIFGWYRIAVAVLVIVLVATGDAVLAMPRSRAQDVKLIVDRLRAAGRAEATEHNRTYRPWGFYESLIQGDRFQVKRIVVQPGRQLSLQSHFHRAEHWVVVSGTARITRGDEVFLLEENQSTYIPPGTGHRLENAGPTVLEIIEVQSGSYLGEDDIIRFEDNYGRHT